MNNNYSSLIEYLFESEDDDMPILPPTDTEQSTGIPIPIL